MVADPPSIYEQLSYFSTGALAGVSTYPIEAAWSSASEVALPKLTNHLKIAVLRAAIRFWTFDQTRTQLTHYSTHVHGIEHPSPYSSALIGGLSGASGGIAEVFYESLVFRRKLPGPAVTANQGTKLFFCFGTYTFLSTNFSDELPPRPFWRCWIMGAAAGASGGGVLGLVDGLRGRNLLAVTAKSGLTIGSIIAVQVTSCAELIKWRSM